MIPNDETSRLTITLPAGLHRALKEAAARRGSTIGDVVAESLRSYGIKSAPEVEALVARAPEASRLEEGAASRLAVAETRAARRRRG
jgi:hypothetical protein